MDKKDNRKLFISYTGIYLFIASVVFCLFYLNGKSLIAYNGDGFREHYQSLVHYSEVLKTILKNIFVDHHFVIPQMDYAIGEGNDILQTMHFLIVGDPMYALSAFVPKEKMYLFFDVCNLLKIYLSGLAFIVLCKNTKKNNWLGILTAATIYAWCSYNVSTLLTHPFFINSSIYLPLILSGVEKVLNKEKPYLLIFSVFLSAITNLYFFYMIVIMVVVYSIVRVLVRKEKFIILINIGLYSFVGVCLAAIIVAPMFYALITNSRLSIERTYATTYGKWYFMQLGFNTVSNYQQTYFGGYTVLFVFAVVSLFKKRNNLSLLILLAFAVLFLSFPFFGRMFNGFSYVGDRWIFGVSLVASYIVVEEFDELFNKKNFILYSIVAVIVFAFCYYYNRDELLYYLVYFAISIGIIFTINVIKAKPLANIAIVGGVIVCILFSFLFLYAPRWYNYVSKGTDIEIFENMYDGQYSAIDSVDDDGYFKYSSNSLFDDSSVLGTHSSTQFYWSVANNYVNEFRKDVALSDHSSIHFDTYDDRYSLMSLASVKYFITEGEDLAPYGYEFLKKDRDYSIYSNNQVLPIMYGYDYYLTKDEWLKLDIVDRNDILTKAVIIDEDSEFVSKVNYQSTYQPVNYEILPSDEVKLDEKQISANKSNGTISINISSDLKGEYYLVVEKLNSYFSSNWTIKTPSGQEKTLFYKSSSHARYSGRHDFVINLGYYDSINDQISISLETASAYNYDSFKIVCQPIDEQIGALAKLNNIDIKDLSIETNRIKANTTTSKDEIVCICLPYSKGWKLKVDGNNQELINVNGQYMGMFLEKGNHDIELIYSTPFLKAGTALSLLTLTAIIVNRIYYKKKVLNEK